jgi:uncharacterized protein
MSLNSDWPQDLPPGAAPLAGPDEASPSPSPENPPWSGWDVLRIALLMFGLPFLLLPIVAVVVQKKFYAGVPMDTVLRKPWLALSTELVVYLFVISYMIMFVEGKLHQRFWPAIRWVWPRRQWPALAVLGAAMVSLQVLERFFRIPQHVPMEDFLSTPLLAAFTGLFAISFGPLMEELFFRGFLYPTLARRFGIFVAVVSTAVPFALIHGLQLEFAWGLVFIIFLVGLVLTIVRAKTGSVAASFVVHVAYNSTLVILGSLSSHHVLK